MATKQLDRVTITHNDSSDPDKVWVSVDGERFRPGSTTLSLTVKEAAEFAERLMFAVRHSGYDMVAQKRKR